MEVYVHMLWEEISVSEGNNPQPIMCVYKKIRSTQTLPSLLAYFTHDLL